MNKVWVLFVLVVMYSTSTIVGGQESTSQQSEPLVTALHGGSVWVAAQQHDPSGFSLTPKFEFWQSQVALQD